MAGFGGLAPPQQETHKDSHTRTQDGHGETKARHAACRVSGLQVANGSVPHVRMQCLRGGGEGTALDGHELQEWSGGGEVLWH